MKFKNMFDKILNEETGRFLTNFFGFNFSIFSNEGNTPHFHFFNGNILNPFFGRYIKVSKDEFISPPKGFI